MAKLKPFQFAEDVKREAKKIAWPTFKETRMSTIMVFIMVALSATFLFSADQIINAVIKMILGIK